MPTAQQIRVSRPLPGVFEFPSREVRFGPEQGFPSRQEALDFFAGAHAAVTWISDKVDDQFLDAVGDQLKVVSNFAVGYDNIDIDACAQRNITVTNTPDAVTEGTAECAVMLILAASRRLAHADRFTRSGDWANHGILGPSDFIGRPVANQNLLIVGAGRIGFATAVRLLGFGVSVKYVARSDKPLFEQAPLCAQRTTLEEGLAWADIVSVHTPLSPQTKHQIGAPELALMKPTAVLVNTARGPIIDEAALVDALANNRIFAAGLDVFEQEPTLHPGLAKLNNVVLTPHMGSASATSRAHMTQLAADNVRAVLEGNPPPTPVTPAKSPSA